MSEIYVIVSMTAYITISYGPGGHFRSANFIRLWSIVNTRCRHGFTELQLIGQNILDAHMLFTVLSTILLLDR
jgi:hypothetical protein